MLRSLKELTGYKVRGTDGDIGTVEEFYFDNKKWIIKYAVVNTGNWLLGRRVLISPSSFGEPRWEDKVFRVHLTKQQVEDSPEIDTDKPVSKEMEGKLANYYGWPMTLGPRVGVPGAQTPVVPVQLPPNTQSKQKLEEEIGDTSETGKHLRSSNEVIGYHIHAIDGDIGHVDDFIIDDSTWEIRYLVAETRNWIKGKDVLMALDWIRWISWYQKKVAVDLSKDEVKDSPEFNPSTPINRKYEEQLYDYYGRPKYW